MSSCACVVFRNARTCKQLLNSTYCFFLDLTLERIGSAMYQCHHNIDTDPNFSYEILYPRIVPEKPFNGFLVRLVELLQWIKVMKECRYEKIADIFIAKFAISESFCHQQSKVSSFEFMIYCMITIVVMSQTLL